MSCDRGVIIRRIDPEQPEHGLAARLILGGNTYPSSQADRNLDEFREVARAQSLNTDLVVGAWDGDRLLAACLAIESPGRTALLITSEPRPGEVLAPWRRRMLEEAQRRAWERGLVLMQALVGVDVIDQAVALRDAGFEYLAELVYQDRDLRDPRPGVPLASDLSYVCYGCEREGEFVAALSASYIGSLDCPRLAGLRNPRDILLGHRHTGMHDPGLWYLALRRGAAAGLLLLSGVRGRSCLEVVYMGVCFGHRGQGVGDALMLQALSVGVERGMDSLVLAVDSTNVHARRLYDRWGFREVGRRRAWMARNPCIE